MQESTRRDAVRAHYEAIGFDEERAGAIYTPDAVLEYPQSSERIRGKANIIATRQAYPGRGSAFTVNEVTQSGDLWVVDLTLTFDGTDPHRVVAVLEFAGDLVRRERIYIADPWEPPAYRAEWVEPI